MLAAGLQDWIDLGVIAGLLLLNAVVGFLQDYQAGNIVQELKNTLAQKCSVLRNGGILAEVDVIHLVPGDIVQLDEVHLKGGVEPRRSNAQWTDIDRFRAPSYQQTVFSLLLGPSYRLISLQLPENHSPCKRK